MRTIFLHIISRFRVLLELIIERKGIFEYQKAIKTTIRQLEDILGLYQKSGLSTQLNLKWMIKKKEIHFTPYLR